MAAQVPHAAIASAGYPAAQHHAAAMAAANGMMMAGWSNILTNFDLERQNPASKHEMPTNHFEFLFIILVKNFCCAIKGQPNIQYLASPASASKMRARYNPY